MNIGAVIQARMGSRRLPGKVLSTICGKPMLGYMIERIRQCKHLDNIVVATSDEKNDNSIVEFCQGLGVTFYRGHPANVASRFKEVLDMYNFDAFLRLSADSPLLDPGLINEAINIFKGGDFDIVTNVLKRTYPKGQSVELLKSDIFLKGYKEMKEMEDFEHVTRFFYVNQKNYKMFNLISSEDYHLVRLCVDTKADLDRITLIVRHMDKPHWSYGLKGLIGIYKDTADRQSA